MPLSMAYLIGSAVFFTFSLVYKFFLCVSNISTLMNKRWLICILAANLLPGNNLISIDIKGIATGFYFIAISSNKGAFLLKRIIKK